MVIQTGDNLFGVAKFIVDPVLGQGTHTTIQAAITASAVGDDIFIRPGIYTEDLTGFPGSLNLTSFTGNDGIASVTIIGKITYNVAGILTISNIRLQTNSDFFLVSSGTLASSVTLNNCNFRCTNNTGISFTTSSSSANIVINSCNGQLTTTGIAYFSSSCPGQISIINSSLANTGASTTANTISSGTLLIIYCLISNPITTSGSAIYNAKSSSFQCSSINTTALTLGSSSVASEAIDSFFSSGTASSISVDAGTLTVNLITVSSSNTNAITGIGTLINGGVSFRSTSSLINTTTQTAKNFDVGGISFNGGTDVLATYASNTFTPAVAFGGSSTGITYSTQSGTYTKIGRMVYCKINLTLSSKGAQTGTATITGLPFTSETNALLSIVPIGWTAITTTATYTSVGVQIASAGTTATLLQFSNTGLNAAVVDNTMFANTTAIFANFFYFAAS